MLTPNTDSAPHGENSSRPTREKKKAGQSGKVNLRQTSISAGVPAPGTPLLSDAEIKSWEGRLKDLEAEHRKGGTYLESKYYAEEKAIKLEELALVKQRVLQRVGEFTDALLLMVAERGTKQYPLGWIFSHSAEARVIVDIERANTPENRRDLHTLMSALKTTPKSWGRSAFVRFLRDNGEQANPKYKYPGKGLFAKEYGWKTDQLNMICDQLLGNRWHESWELGRVLNSFADVADEIREDDEEMEKEGSYKATFSATRAERNNELIDEVLSVLERRGLAPMPEPKKSEPKPPRQPKQFSPGDKIRSATLRDLPLPALVRVQIEKCTDGKREEWKPGEIDIVVRQLGNQGGFKCYIAGPAKPEASERVAHRGNVLHYSYSWERKELLHGAEYLGPFKGKFDEREVRAQFMTRKVGDKW